MRAVNADFCLEKRCAACGAKAVRGQYSLIFGPTTNASEKAYGPESNKHRHLLYVKGKSGRDIRFPPPSLSCRCELRPRLRNAMESVNLEHIREATMGDDEFLAELITLFLNDTPQQLEALRKAVRTGDAETAASAAHRLKGSSSNMGAESLSALCLHLEKSSSGKQLEELPRLVEQVDEEFDQVREILTNLRGELG